MNRTVGQKHKWNNENKTTRTKTNRLQELCVARLILRETRCMVRILPSILPRRRWIHIGSGQFGAPDYCCAISELRSRKVQRCRCVGSKRSGPLRVTSPEVQTTLPWPRAERLKFRVNMNLSTVLEEWIFSSRHNTNRLTQGTWKPVCPVWRIWVWTGSILNRCHAIRVYISPRRTLTPVTTVTTEWNPFLETPRAVVPWDPLRRKHDIRSSLPIGRVRESLWTH